jgi:hypothetical protein
VIIGVFPAQKSKSAASEARRYRLWKTYKSMIAKGQLAIAELDAPGESKQRMDRRFLLLIRFR